MNAPRGPRRNSIAAEQGVVGPDSGGTIDSLGGFAADQVGARRLARIAPVPNVPGLYLITLNNTGSGWQEQFLLQVPNLPPGAVAPLLVVFHKYGVSQWDVQAHTTFLTEAQNRNWYVVAPLGATEVSFSSLESQINTQAVLDFVASFSRIDRVRVYGVGFSMGGGSVTNYAARHLDPAGVMFAAITNHTGDVSLANVYANEVQDVLNILDYWYGGPPSLYPFNYSRCSAIDLDQATGTIASGTDVSRNLSHVPILDWVASNDPVTYLYNQMIAFDGHVHAQNAGNQFNIAAGSVHSWNTLDETQVCDYLAQFTLQIPNSASTLADEDGQYFHFQIEQEAPGSFTPFTWNIDGVQNRFDLSATTNLKRLSVDSIAAGLTFNRPVVLNLSTSDGSGDRVLFHGVPHAPSIVIRDGLPATGTYDAQAMSFEVRESDGSPHQWVLSFF